MKLRKNIFVLLLISLSFVTATNARSSLRQRRRPGSQFTITTMPMVGLVSLCLAFVGIAVLGILIGTQIDASIFTEGITIGTVFSNSLSAMTLFRVLIMYLPGYSFCSLTLFSMDSSKAFNASWWLTNHWNNNGWVCRIWHDCFLRFCQLQGKNDKSLLWRFEDRI